MPHRGFDLLLNRVHRPSPKGLSIRTEKEEKKRAAMVVLWSVTSDVKREVHVTMYPCR